MLTKLYLTGASIILALAAGVSLAAEPAHQLTPEEEKNFVERAEMLIDLKLCALFSTHPTTCAVGVAAAIQEEEK